MMEPVMSYRKRWIGSAIASMRHHAEAVNLEQHYYCKASKLSAELQASWVQLHYDEECHRFVESCEDVSWTQTFAASCLMSCFGWSVTDTNGFLNRGQMHVLSTLQFRQLLSSSLPTSKTSSIPTSSSPDTSPTSSSSTSSSSISSSSISRTSVGGMGPFSLVEPEDPVGVKLLDVGAGDGHVTQHLARLFRSVVATEVSQPMVGRLQERGWDAILTASVEKEVVGGDFDCVAFLNVLDRCDRPFSMLQQMRRLLTASTASGRPGVLLIAVVLPFRPFVESGADQLRPTERFKQLERCSTFEAAASSLAATVFAPAGLRVRAFSRVPYISRGDMNQSFYLLSDAIFVLEPLSFD